MKESKFIELLNLYIDHQISPEGAAQLEQEILQDPRRRQTYNQYCRMQRACTLVLDQFKTPVPAGAAGGFSHSESAGRRRGWSYYAAGLAAAAVALVAIQALRQPGGFAPREIAQPNPRNPALVSSDPVMPAPAVRRETPVIHRPAQTESFINERLGVISPLGTARLAVTLQSSDPMPALLVAPQRPAVQRRPRPSIEQFVFATEPADPSPDALRIFRNRRFTDEEAVNAALQYSR